MWRNVMFKCRSALFKALLMICVAMGTCMSAIAELPDLSGASMFGGDGVSTATYRGGASSDNGTTYKSDFDWKDSIDATVEITVQAGDVGETGSIYVLIYIPGYGFVYQDGTGQFQSLTSFDAISPAVTDKTLEAVETVNVFTDIVLNDLGLDGFTFNIWAGYSVSSDSSVIHYHAAPVTINADSIPDFTDPNEAALALETAKQHISTTTPLSFYVDLDEAAENLVISFAEGFDRKALGDPDLYVKYGEEASTSNFDCVSYRGSGSNETCIISKPQAGRYHIYIDAFEGGDVTDATLWASVELLKANRSCNDNLVIQAQDMTEEELDTACAQINRAGDIFFDVFANISPEPGVPVAGDLNEVTSFTVFSSLSNHRTWINYLWNDSTNESGIYYEVSPTEWWHRSDIISFNPIEWTDGLSMIRSGAHEYIHALDGRYLKEGAYRSETGWWSEGLAEYMGNFYDTPYDRLEISLSDSTPPTLAEIFDQHNNGGVPSPYEWGQLAVAYFIQVHPGQVAIMVGHMRNGEWDQWAALLDAWAVAYQNDFAAWLTSGPRADFENSAQALELGSYALVEGRSGWLFSVDVPEGTDSVTFNLSGGSPDAGSMDVDMMVSAGVVPHSSFENVDCTSATEGNNETCTFSPATAGTYYITLDVYNSWAADIVDVYLTACAGTDCTVSLPEPKEIKEVVDFPLPVQEVLPEANTIGGCEYVRPYSRSGSAEITITNTTDTPVILYWISSTTGEPVLSNPYGTLQQGESYTADFWAVGDRMMIADLNNNCLGVAVLTETSNTYEIEAEHVVDADSSQHEPAAIGGCDLVTTYTRTGTAASIRITNTTSTPVTLYWVSDSTGEPYLASSYGTLQQGESYFADFWAVGDRMMIADADDNCLGVAELTSTSNEFEVDADLVGGSSSSAFGGCDLVTTYTRTGTAASISVTNTTSTPVTLYWISDSTGSPYLPSPYATLQQGETYFADFWVIGDRMMIADADDNCLGVADLTEATNVFEVDAELVGETTNTNNGDPLSGCDLAVPYSRASDSASISVTNTTTNPVTLYWVHDGTGSPYTPSPYATLQQGETYFADFWVIGDRMMLSDANDNCLAIADLSKANNVFEIDESLFN